jgi:hypothetical protein
VLRTLTVACVAACLGIMAFFSFAVAPLTFRTIDRSVAGELVSAVLPRYYGWGLALCAAALATAILRAPRAAEPRWRPAAAAILCAAMLALLGWASAVVLPRGEQARRARDDVAFVAAHRSAVRLNALTLLAGAALLVLEAVRRGDRGDR